jgi:hypothetical protein
MRQNSTRSVDLDQTSRFKAALELWLRWNDVYQQVTADLFDARKDQTQLTEFMDQMDRLRVEAIEVSRKLLER